MQKVTANFQTDIRQMMRDEGAWSCAINMRVYTVEEFITRCQDCNSPLSEKLKSALRERINRLQSYFDDRILEPK